MRLLPFSGDALGRPWRSQEHQRYYSEWLAVALAALCGVALFVQMQWGAVAGQVIYDQFHRWRAPSAANDIVVIAVDDASLDALGGWPLRRTVYADVLKQLADSDNLPAAVGFDILFRDARPDDEALARQMQRHRVFLAVELSRQHNGQTTAPISPVLAQAARGLAQVGLTFESDGFLRGVRLSEGGVPQLALAMSGRPAEDFSTSNSYCRFDLVDPAMGFPVVSLADVVSGGFPLGLLKDKYVLLGAVAPSLGDHYPTIYSGQQGAGMPGVFLHASILNAIFRDGLISPVSAGLQLGLSWLAVVLAMLALLVLSPLAEILVSSSLVVLTLACSFLLLVTRNLWFDPAIALFAIVLLKPVWVWRRNGMVVRFMTERVLQLQPYQRGKTRTRTTLGLRHFTSDTVFQYSRTLDRLIRDARERLGFLNAVIQESPNAMLVADVLDGRIVMCNPRMQEAMPVSLSGVGQAVPALLLHLGLEPAGGLASLAGPGRYVSATDMQGQQRHYMFHAAQLPPGAEQTLWLFTMVDITELRDFQAQRDRTLQLLSHDMRTPIASIIVLSRQASQGHVPDAQTSGRIARNATSLLQMMDDFILAIQADAPRYQMQETLMDEVVDEAVYQVKDWAQSRRMHWRVDTSPEPLFIHTDQRLLIRMLLNLLTNAVRHGQADTEIHIALTLQAPDSPTGQAWVQLRIGNTVGAQEDSAAAPAAQGFGLGLEFVRTVVRKHHGQLQLDIPSEAGRQAVVMCLFPVAMPSLL